MYINVVNTTASLQHRQMETFDVRKRKEDKAFVSLLLESSGKSSAREISSP